MLPKIIDELTEVISYYELQSPSTGIPAEKELRQLLWLEALEYLSSATPVTTEKSCTKYLVGKHSRQLRKPHGIPAEFLADTRITSESIRQLFDEITFQDNTTTKEDSIKGYPEDTETGSPDKQNQAITGKASEIRSRQPWPDKKANHVESKPGKDSSSIKTELRDGIYVSHAGLILLHPFLHAVFRNLGYVQNGHFPDELNHQKAIYLLHYLATGQVVAEEYELVMAKILTAYPVEKPIDKQVKPAEQDIFEADLLLEEIIRQWSILRGSTIQGLREGFLQRGGKFYMVNDRMNLQVEASTIDVLLDHLPWNLHLVSLPWLDDVLQVEWR
jgi:hypothetical protein